MQISFGIDETSYYFQLNRSNIQKLMVEVGFHPDLKGIHVRPRRFRLQGVRPGLVVSYETSPRKSDNGFPKALWYKHMEDDQFDGPLHVIHYMPEMPIQNTVVLISPDIEVETYEEFCAKGGELCLDTEVVDDSIRKSSWGIGTHDALLSKLPDKSIRSVHISLIDRRIFDLNAANEWACTILASVLRNKKAADKLLIILRLQPATWSPELLSQFIGYVKSEGIRRVLKKEDVE